jgi:hypothetical protein
MVGASANRPKDRVRIAVVQAGVAPERENDDFGPTPRGYGHGAAALRPHAADPHPDARVVR